MSDLLDPVVASALAEVLAKNKDALGAKAMLETLAKVSPTAGSRITSLTQQAKALTTPGFFTRTGQAFDYLIRGVTPLTWFGPGQPIAPQAQRPEQGALGRRFDFGVSQNISFLPKMEMGQGIPFWMLRNLRDAYDLLALAVETRKDQAAGFEWEILPKEKGAKKDDFKEQVKKVSDFFERPSREDDWPDFLRQIVDDSLVVDGVALYPRMTRGGDLYSLTPIDATTIKILVDETGMRPEGDSPAYQQVMKGVPAVDYKAEELLYWRRNRRTNRVYGYSPVEQVITTINIAIRRQKYQLEYYCYSEDTEVLTRRGWLRFGDCAETDEFATRQIGSGHFTWQRAHDFFREWFDGEMVSVKGRSVDLLVTPEHRMLIRGSPSDGDVPQMQEGGEYVITAGRLAERGAKFDRLPRTSKWDGCELGEQRFDPPTSSTNQGRALILSGDDFCAFMGMYLAEGNVIHTGNKPGHVYVAAQEGSRSHDTYRALLNRVFASVGYSGHQFEMCSVAFASYLRRFGKASDKYVPEIIKGASRRQLEVFWRYYYLGDGAARADGDNEATAQCYTVSRRLADDLTEIAQKIGFATTIWERSAGTSVVNGRTVTARRGWMVSASRSPEAIVTNAKYERYRGYVACVCVPSKFLYVRRNGKALWCGNTDGNIPDSLIGVPDTWTPEQIEEFQDQFDAMLQGNTAERRKARFVPDVKAIMTLKDSQITLTDQADEWFARIICFAFSIAPIALLKMVNRAAGQQIAQSAKEEGNIPYLNWLATKFSQIINDPKLLNCPDVKFSWQFDVEVDPEVKARIRESDVKSGIRTVDEARREEGLQPRGIDELFVITAGGPVPLKESLDRAREDAINPPQPPAPFGAPGGDEPKVGPDGKPIKPSENGKQPPPKNGKAQAQVTKTDRGDVHVTIGSPIIEVHTPPVRVGGTTVQTDLRPERRLAELEKNDTVPKVRKARAKRDPKTGDLLAEFYDENENLSKRVTVERDGN